MVEDQIRLGDVEHIPAVIWYSDLSDSTAMAERLLAEVFLQTVNAYFDRTAGTVLEHGGGVLRFIGDAVLAMFPMPENDSPQASARQALRAAEQATTRLTVLNQLLTEHSQERIAFGLGLHRGELLYGNIGVPSRIEFSVIGRAAKEVSRLESLTRRWESRCWFLVLSGMSSICHGVSSGLTE